MSTTFAQLGVPDSICRALERNGIHKPFDIQAASIADSLDGRDICGRAPTGSGKTLAFGIPLVASASQAKAKRPRALILAPTRELADQIAEELRTFAGQIRVGVVYGGVSYGNQVKRLRQGVDILVACPGRLEDLIGQRAVNLCEVDQVVIDEADRMADMGFLPAVRRILDQIAARPQTLLFSATLDGDVAKLTRDYQHNPATHEIGDTTPDVTAADHRFLTVDKAERIGICVDVIAATGSTILFCRTRHGSDRLARQLSQRGINAAAIHGGHAQNRRSRTLQQFVDGRIEALVATDVAARGIHVDEVASVIHFDPPEDHKAYLHRSGRTARAGQSGLVVSLIQSDQVGNTKKMQRQLGLEQPITRPDHLALHTARPNRPERHDSDAPRRNGHKPAGQRQSNQKRSNSTRNGHKPAGQRQNNQKRSNSTRNGHKPAGQRQNNQKPSNSTRNRHKPAGQRQQRPQGQNRNKSRRSQMK